MKEHQLQFRLNKKYTKILLLLLFLILILILVRSFSKDDISPKEMSFLKEGEAIYQKGCASCHGDQGMPTGSLIGTALNNQHFLNTFSKEDIINVVTNGRQGTSMPNFESSLSEEEIKKVSSWVVHWKKEELNLDSPDAVTGNAANGEALYQYLCLSCHGEQGIGKQGRGTALTNQDFLKYTTDKQMWISIAYGREGTAMGPSLKGKDGVKQLSEQEISDIVAYIRKYQK